MMATMQVPFVDLRAQHAPICRDAIDQAIRGAVDRGDFILGAAVERFETEYAAFIGTRHAIGVGTGLAAIELALRAFGVGPGDEVDHRRPTRSSRPCWRSWRSGRRPVFVDMDPATYAIDPARDRRGDHVAHARRSCRCTCTVSRSISTRCWRSRGATTWS